MDDLRAIAKYYGEISDEQLELLADKPEQLRPELIAVLQKELLNRGMEEQLIQLNGLLANKPKRQLKDFSDKELKELVAQRLDEGEPMNVIMQDLRENDVDSKHIFRILDNDVKQ